MGKRSKSTEERKDNTDTVTEPTTTAAPKESKSKPTERDTVQWAYPEDIRIIGLDTKDGPEHYLYDDRFKLPLDPGMVDSILARGVIKPIFVTRSFGDKMEDLLLKVDGLRRILHAREANRRLKEAGEKLLKIPYLVKSGNAPTLRGMMRAANRMAVVDDPVTNGRNAKLDMEFGATIEEVAIDYGVQVQTVEYWLQLLTAPPEIIAAVEAKELSGIAGATLARLPPEQASETFAELKAEGETITAQRAARAVNDKQGKATKKTPKERIETAHAKLQSFADKYGLEPDKAPKEEMVALIEGLSKCLLSMGLKKLADTGD